MSFGVDVSIEAEGWHALSPNLTALCDAAVGAALAEAGETTDDALELSILFCDDARITALNADFRGKRAPTNVLSFPPAEGGITPPGAPHFLGDIALALETVQREAAEAGKTPRAHLTHLIIHGTLHLLGYDHISDDDAGMMETREVAALARLDVSNPYEA